MRDDLPATLRFVPVQALAANAPTEVRFPLADAATTYLVEAIHWREDGWLWSQNTRIRVDREVVVDAPVPVTATEGDVLALPVRVRSQGAQRTLRLGVRGEDGIAFDAIDVGEVTVPAGEARSRIAQVPLRRAGRGRVVVAAFEGTTPRDAMGRPMEVLPAGRLEGLTVDSLTPVGGEVSFEIPEGATWRRAPTLTVSGAGRGAGADPHGMGRVGRSARGSHARRRSASPPAWTASLSTVGLGVGGRRALDRPDHRGRRAHRRHRAPDADRWRGSDRGRSVDAARAGACVSCARPSTRRRSVARSLGRHPSRAGRGRSRALELAGRRSTRRPRRRWPGSAKRAHREKRTDGPHGTSPRSATRPGCRPIRRPRIRRTSARPRSWRWVASADDASSTRSP
ncbi:MAG: hypothetical protein H6722_14295 [Sandaracinus sp.]|nr:hypothetical protein [Sandaracinus sp.]